MSILDKGVHIRLIDDHSMVKEILKWLRRVKSNLQVLREISHSNIISRISIEYK